MYIPELIFGNLLTSSSYDDKKIRVSAGMHGLGAKLTAIFSKQFIVEVGDPKSKKKYRQIFSNSLSKKSPPRISSYNKTEGFVKIKYIPHAKNKVFINIIIIPYFPTTLYNTLTITTCHI